MFSVGERVIHPGQGLCTIVDVEQEPVPTLVLSAGNGHGTTRLRCPAHLAETTLHEPVSKQEALRVIEGYEAMPCDPHTDRNSGLEESYFKGLIKHGVPACVQVVKTMRARQRAAAAARRKPSTYVARILKEARRRSIEELAWALDVDAKDVPSLFGEARGDFTDK